MASQEEDNRLECISNVNKEQERYYLNVYKKYDSILNDKSESFENKVSSLIEVWTSISELNLSQFDIRYVIQIIDWAKLHALNIVLTGEWRSTKESFRNSLLESIEKAQNSLAAVNEAFSSRCQKLADVVKKPWEDPVLANLIQEKDVEIGPKEIEFFCVETAYLVSVRLKKLCENHCEDLALNLVTNFLNYKKLATVQNFNLNATETQLWFIFDIYIALLYKFQNKAKILQQFEDLQLDEGVMLIKRFAKKRVKISKIWRNCHKIAIFGSRFFMSRALMKYTEEYKDYLTELLKTYLTLSNTEALLQEFVLSVRNITNLADAAGLCVMCEVIHREAADKLRVFAIEMYIRALTTDMNELERLKHVNEEDKVKSTTSRLAKTFTNLADLLDDHVKVARECILTAFSLEPTKDRLKRIEDLAKRSGFPVLDTGQEWKCRLHPPILPSDDLAWVCPECGEWMCKPELTAPLQMNMALHEALQESVLGISEALCDDLVVCLSNPRYHILSWLLAWGDLYRLCILYLNDPEKTKNFVTELKFVDVDYSMFEHIKREPVDEFTGIEKGYEQYLDLDFVSDEETSSVSEDSMSHDRSVGLGSDGTGEPHLSLLQPKSDPVTLKSLRMFRPNLKRKKEDSSSPSLDKKAAMESSNGSSSLTSSSGSSLENYLSSPLYNPRTDYSVTKSASHRTYTPNIPNKIPPSSVYLPQAAGVTHNSIPNLSQAVAAASNFSSLGYSSIYGAKTYEIHKKPSDKIRNKFDPTNSDTRSSYGSNLNPKGYPTKLPKHSSLSESMISHNPANSVFNTTNLGSVASSSYVSNIIKSTLSYGVPRATVTAPSYTSTNSTETITSSHSFGPLKEAKQDVFATPKHGSFSTSKQGFSTAQKHALHLFATPNLAKQKNTPYLASQKNISQHDTFDPHNPTHQKNTSQHIPENTVPDLDALLNEIDTNKYETDSKNGVAATLLQLGGQVAKNLKQSIQVTQQVSLIPTPTKSQQETSSPNGTKEDCRTRPKSKSKNPKLPGVLSDLAMEPPCKRARPAQESPSPDKVSLPGQTIIHITQDLRIKMPRLNLEKYTRQDQCSQTGETSAQVEAATQTQKAIPIITDDSQIRESTCITPAKTPPDHIPRANTQDLPQEVLQTQPITQLSTQELSTEQESQTLPCQKVQSFMCPEQPHQKATIPSAAPPLQIPEAQLKTASTKGRPPRFESVIVISPIRAREIISQALLNQRQGSKELPSEPHSASISLVKNRECLVTTSTRRSLLKTGDNKCPQIPPSQLSDKNLESQTKSPTICTQADSPRIVIPIITGCDKDRKVQKYIQKTDVELTEIIEDATSLTDDNNKDRCMSQISSTKTDKNESSTDRLIKQTLENREVSRTHDNNDSIIIDSNLARDKISVENKTNAKEVIKNSVIFHCKSNNQDDVKYTDKTSNTFNKMLTANDRVGTEKIVNKIMDCDKETTEIKNIKSAESENKKSVWRVEEWLDEAEVISNKEKPILLQDNKTVIRNNDMNVEDNKQIRTDTDPTQTNNISKNGSILSLTNNRNQNKTNFFDSTLQNISREKDMEIEFKGIDYIMDNDISTGHNIVDHVYDGPSDIDMEHVPTVGEIKENIQQSIRSQEVIKTYKEVIKVKIVNNDLKYIKYLHNYCNKPQLLPKSLKLVKQGCLATSLSKSTLPSDMEECFLFTDAYSDNYADINKENIKGSDESTTSDKENNASTEKKNATSEKYSRFNNKSSKNNQNIKKYFNTHKRKHENVPCFKVDQEKINKDHPETSTVENFKIKELSVVLQRLSHKMTRPVQKSTTNDSITVLQQRLRKKINDKANTPICVVYKKEKPSSPLLDFNIRAKAEEMRRQAIRGPDYIRQVIVSQGCEDVLKKLNFRKGSMRSNAVKKKSDFPLKRPKKKKNGHYEVQPDPNREKKRIDANMLKNVPGLNDFSEVRPCNTQHVVNVVQVSGSRTSTANNQNTQTSTQVTPHIQRIGQPKLPEQKSDRLQEKSDQSPSSSTTTNIDSVKPSTSQSSTLINILSSQLKPGQKNSVAPRQAPIINILSQQILKQPDPKHIKPSLKQNVPTLNPIQRDNPTSHTSSKTATVIKVEPEETVESQASKSVNTNVKIVTSTTQACGAVATATTSSQGGTILQFICKSSSLPKFQQAFGKTVYQTSTGSEASTETASATATENTSQIQTATVLETKKVATKAVPVNVQPIAGNVIFRGQVPVGQTVSLIPPGSNTRQLFRITGSTHEQISLVKETVIQNKMSALLAAALQGKPKITEQNGELVEEYSATRITLCRPGTVPPNATKIVKPVQVQIPANVIKAPQPNLSSTTLEQLREFDMVYKQVKERSGNPAQPETASPSSQDPPQQQRISFTYVNQVQKYSQLAPVVVVSSYSPLQQPVSPALSVTSQSGAGTCLTQVSTVTVPKVAVKTSKGKNIKSSATKTSPTAVPTIPKPQQKPQEDEHTTQRIFDILAEYAEQLRNSPDLNNKPAPRRRSNPPTNPSSSTSGSGSSKKKKKKSSSSSTSNMVETDNEDLTMGSEDSSGGNVVQLSMTDEEQSQSASITPPETNLEPATSNTPSAPRPLIVTDTSNQTRNVIIADSSVGEALKMPNTALLMPGSYIMPVSVVKGGQQIAVVSGGSKILTTVPARSGQNMLLFQSFVNQGKKGGISTVKYSTIQPFAGISSQSVAGVSAQPPVVLPTNSVATVALGQPITLKKLDDNERGTNTELLLTIAQPRETIKVEHQSDIPQPDSSTNLPGDTIEVKLEEGTQSDSSSNEVFNNIQKTNSVATSVIASVVKKEQEERSETAVSIDRSNKGEQTNKQAERIGSVLVNASTSNGPMLSHTNSRYRKPSDNVESTTAPTKEFNHNSGKVPTSGTKIFKNNAVYYAIRTKKPIGKKPDGEMQKQAAMERELRLQKSLSEECEDLGVDEPSTSDLFPEADLLFDSNHSPSYDQTGQRIQVADGKAKATMNLFSDDENSGPMRNDLFDYVEYHPSETNVDQINGNNESASSCDDSTLLPNCGAMSEVTLNSPISPEYTTDSNNAINKYKYKYTNRKKGDKPARQQTECWSEITEVTSTEDTIEIAKEDETPIAIQEETVIEETVTEVETVVESKTYPEKEVAPKCPVHGYSEKGSRRNLRKPCSCFNGSKSQTSLNAKRRVSSPKSQSSTPSKKPLLSKKR